MEEPPANFTGFSNKNDMVRSFYQKLNDGTDMYIDESSEDASNLSMAADDNTSASASVGVSVASNNSRTSILSHPHPGGSNRRNLFASLARSMFDPTKPGRNLKDDALAKVLMDINYPTEGLEKYEEWTIDLTKLIVGAAFAEGAFGRLFNGRYKGEDVAIKVLERQENRPEIAQALERQFHQEVTMLATLNHPNIVRFIGACRKPTVWCIVTEYAKGGSVRQFLQKRQSGPMPLKLAVKQALDVAKGMAYIHGHGFIHRDLKSDNLLIGADKSIKIADFGVARIEVQTEGMTPNTGTYRWMAPEMIQNRPYSHKVDVYSFGIVLWELITGLLPYQSKTAVEAAKAVVEEGTRPDIPKDCLPLLREIMTCCWDANPDARPPFTRIIEMLRNAETEIMTTVRKARFRCCVTQPVIID